MTTVSGLVKMGTETELMGHPHQVSNMLSPGDRLVQVLNFDDPAFNKDNRIDIPILDMVVDDMWVEFQCAALGGATNEAFQPTPSWINSNGVQLLYKNQSIYTMSEAEAFLYDRVNAPSALVYQKWQDAQNDTSDSIRRARGTVASIYYLHLGPIVNKILSHVGPLNAYPSKAWSLRVGLLPFANLVDTSSGDSITGGTLTAMRLICCGLRESGDTVQEISDALASTGVRLSFSQSNHLRSVYGSSAGPVTIQLTALEGEAVDAWILQRVTAGLNSTTPTTVNHYQFQEFPLAGDTVEMGTQSNPTRVFGLALPQRTVKLLEQAKSYSGSPVFVGSDGARVNDEAMYISLTGGSTVAQLFGSGGGSLRLKNNFQYILRFSTDTSANTVDTIVYVVRDMLLKHEGLIMVNRED